MSRQTEEQSFMAEVDTSPVRKLQARLDTKTAMAYAEQYLCSGDVDDLKKCRAYIDSVITLLEANETNEALSGCTFCGEPGCCLNRSPFRWEDVKNEA